MSVQSTDIFDRADRIFAGNDEKFPVVIGALAGQFLVDVLFGFVAIGNPFAVDYAVRNGNACGSRYFSGAHIGRSGCFAYFEPIVFERGVGEDVDVPLCFVFALGGARGFCGLFGG